MNVTLTIQEKLKDLRTSRERSHKGDFYFEKTELHQNKQLTGKHRIPRKPDVDYNQESKQAND